MAFVMSLGRCAKKILTKFLQDRTSYFGSENNKHGLFKVWSKYKLLLATLNYRPKTGRKSNEAKKMRFLYFTYNVVLLHRK